MSTSQIESAPDIEVSKESTIKSAAEPKARVLFVDDEESVLNALRRVFHNDKDLLCEFADSPRTALDLIGKHDFAVLVCDHRMPGMTGAEFLTRIKEKRPDMVRIMLTGQADLTDIAKAVNEGEVFRFLMKPWEPDSLRNAVRSAVEQHRLTAENKRLNELTLKQNEQLSRLTHDLEQEVQKRSIHLLDALHTAQTMTSTLQQSLHAVADTFFSLIELANPGLGAHCRRVAIHATALAETMGISGNDLKEVQIAALLHDCGKLGFPSFMLEKTVQDLLPKEQQLYQSHPSVAVEHLKQLKGYENICEFILYHHEAYNGSGFPEGIKGGKVPLPSYLIGLVDTYDHLIHRIGPNRSFVQQHTIQTIQSSVGTKYPDQLVHKAVEYFAGQTDSNDEDVLTVGLANISPGMTLASDLYSMGGTLLLAKGQTLTKQNIRRVRSIALVDPILKDIKVYPKPR